MSGILMAPSVVGLTPFEFVQTISADTSNYILTNAAKDAGWNGVSPLKAKITINSGIVVSSSTSFTTSPGAFRATGLPNGSSLELINNGFIVGIGGSGGAAKTDLNGFNVTNGGNGGPALVIGLPTTITNNGTIAGGGGGGGGYAYSVTQYFCGGGGGRSGRTNSTAGTATGATTGNYPGAAGTYAAAGAGGMLNASYSAGAGGGWGAAGGQPSTTVSATGLRGAPGSGGDAVEGNSYITWLVTGTRLGGIVA